MIAAEHVKSETLAAEAKEKTLRGARAPKTGRFRKNQSEGLPRQNRRFEVIKRRLAEAEHLHRERQN